jgi:cardiolipin synthase
LPYADDGQVEAAQSDAVEEASRHSVALSDAERETLSQLRSWAQSAAHKQDSKAKAIVDWITNLIAAWKISSMPCAELAGFLKGATAAYAHIKGEQEIEIVWTGPSSALIATRKTEQALLEVIQASRSRLFITSFVAYDVSSIMKALEKAVSREVQVSMLLEASEKDGGGISFDVIGKMKTELPAATVYSWVAKTDKFAGGKVHAKIAVADERICFVSSANLTGHAMERNMEAGILIRGGNAPRELQCHLEALVTTYVVAKV